MNLSSDRYWQALGIPVWKLREVAPASPIQTYILMNKHSNELVAAILADGDSTAEQELLAKIVDALAAKLTSVDLDKLIDLPNTRCILFGQHLLQHATAGSFKQTLVVSSLQAMLGDSSLKKAAWEKLRPFKQ